MLRSVLSRRGIIGLGLAAGSGLFLPRLVRADTMLPLTPACMDGDEPTASQTEGPYFTPNSPERTNFVIDGIEGPHLTLTGFALDRQCRPIPHALLDLWHCDAAGRYDNQGYRLRGHQFADTQGRFAFETIVPAIYPGRTRHYHLKVQAPGGDVLTQLYFPGEPGNEHDRIFDATLLMDLTPADDRQIGRYDFVLA